MSIPNFNHYNNSYEHGNSQNLNQQNINQQYDKTQIWNETNNQNLNNPNFNHYDNSDEHKNNQNLNQHVNQTDMSPNFLTILSTSSNSQSSVRLQELKLLKDTVFNFTVPSQLLHPEKVSKEKELESNYTFFSIVQDNENKLNLHAHWQVFPLEKESHYWIKWHCSGETIVVLKEGKATLRFRCGQKLSPLTKLLHVKCPVKKTIKLKTGEWILHCRTDIKR